MTPSTLTLRRLKRVRWAVRGALTLGALASVAANILHAKPGPISAVIAAWPPLALLATIELVSRVPVHRTWLAIVRRFGTTTIAGIAAWVSYWHMVGVAQRYGETGAAPFLLPLSVDGLVVVASVSLLELNGRIRNAQQPVAEVAPDVQECAEDEPGDVMASDTTATVDPNNRTAKRIRQLRARNPKLTQEQVARKTGFSVRNVARYWPVTAPDNAPDTDAAPVDDRAPELATTT